jgi:hypothetical protein
MKKFDVKVDNSSDYWCDFEGELSVYGFLKWRDQKLLELFMDKIVFFAWDYISLSSRFGIATSTKSFESFHHFQAEFELYKKGFEDIRYHNPLLFIHTYKDSWVFPSILFTMIEENPKNIICINPILNIDQLKDQYISQSSSMPIKIALDIGFNGIDLYYYLDNDVFNSWIDNKKTKRDPEIGGKDLWVDNSELAYLNTPRLNSFLRDLKKLCFKYGATEFQFENLGLNDFCEDGVMFNGEVVYYEDIVGMLEPHHRIIKSPPEV